MFITRAMFRYYASVVFLWCTVSCAEVITSIQVPSNISADRSVTFNISTPDDSNSNVFIKYVNVDRDLCEVNISVISIPESGGFYVIQFHSFNHDFQLENVKGETVFGRNTGLVEVKVQRDVGYVYKLSCIEGQELKASVKVLLAVVLYNEEDPIPGGCNLTFEPETAAYQNVSYTEAMVQIDAQLSSSLGQPCENNTVPLEMYYLHLTEQKFDEKEYFEAIERMLSVSDITKHSKSVPPSSGLINGRRYYNAYLGTGTVYAVVARVGNRTSAYIPIVSYACDTQNWDENCIPTGTTVWKIIHAFLIFLGCFMLFNGHIFITPQMFVTGFIFGCCCGYLIAGSAMWTSIGGTVALAAVLGFLLGSVWILIWGGIGVPIVVLILPLILKSYIISSILFYFGSDYIPFVREYYGTDFLTVLAVLSIFLVVPTYLHIQMCCFLGASAISIALNHYAGGSLQYIFLTSYRQITVQNFSQAIINPVFQTTDIFLSISWMVLLVLGITIQAKMAPSKFPKNPSMDFLHRLYMIEKIRNFRRLNEGTPLLQ